MLTQAVILCGGLGTRLGDLTRETPKPLLPVGGRPFLDHLVQEVSRFGIEDILLLAGRFGEKVRAAFEGRKINGATVRVLIEPRPLGTGGALKFGEHALRDEFFVLNGDSWIDADLVLAGLQWSRASRTVAGLNAQMLLRHVPDARRYGSVSCENGIVTGFAEKSDGGAPRPDLVNAGVYIIRKSLVSALPPEQEVSLERDVFPVEARGGRIASYVVPTASFFIDIGIPDDYVRAQTEIPAARTRPALFLDRDGTLNRDDGYTHRPKSLEWLPGAREAVRLANERGYYVFAVSNQAGVARGFYREEDVVAFQKAMQAELFEIGGHVDAFETCPHHEAGHVPGYPVACRSRKPAPGMITDLLGLWPVDAERSVLVGNAESDVEAGRVAGIRSVPYRGGSLSDLVAELITD